MPNALVVFCDIEADGAEAQLDRHLEASSRVRGVRIREHPGDPDTAAFKKRLSKQDFAALMKARQILYDMYEDDGKDDTFTVSLLLP